MLKLSNGGQQKTSITLVTNRIEIQKSRIIAQEAARIAKKIKLKNPENVTIKVNKLTKITRTKIPKITKWKVRNI